MRYTREVYLPGYILGIYTRVYTGLYTRVYTGLYPPWYTYWAIPTLVYFPRYTSLGTPLYLTVPCRTVVPDSGTGRWCRIGPWALVRD